VLRVPGINPVPVPERRVYENGLSPGLKVGDEVEDFRFYSEHADWSGWQDAQAELEAEPEFKKETLRKYNWIDVENGPHWTAQLMFYPGYIGVIARALGANARVVWVSKNGRFARLDTFPHHLVPTAALLIRKSQWTDDDIWEYIGGMFYEVQPSRS
jgi:hypothetical protein